MKEILTTQGLPLAGNVLLQIEDLCFFIITLSMSRPAKVLSPMARQEVLKLLMSEKRISSQLPELKRLKRNPDFFKKLDRSLQQGRKTFSNYEEDYVFEQKLLQMALKNPLRAELKILTEAYEAWLDAMEVYDLPLLLKEAVAKLESGLPPDFFPIEEIFHFSYQTKESLEDLFWDLLSKVIAIKKIKPTGEIQPKSIPILENWHTFDDAAEALAENLCHDFEDQAILIPDSPAIRRSLFRALGDAQIPVSNLRDPTQIKMNEGVKCMLLPLELCAKNFEREKVLSWCKWNPKFYTQEIISEISARGIKKGLPFYKGGRLSLLYDALLGVSNVFTGKKTVAEVAQVHLRWLKVQTKDQSLSWLFPFSEKIWEELQEDFNLVGLSQKKAPLLFWLERLRVRLLEASPPASALKTTNGIEVHRLGQISLKKFKKIYLFGIPPSYLSDVKGGDYWFTQTERELLSQEFLVSSTEKKREEKKLSLKSWMSRSDEVVFISSHYDWDGREREPLKILFLDLGMHQTLPLEKGAHPRFLKSLGPIRSCPPLEFKLHATGPETRKNKISASVIDYYSRCAFLALGAGRWKLWDQRKPGIEPWPEVKGRILHLALRILKESPPSIGPSIGPFIGSLLRPSLEQALEQAWQKETPRGMWRGPKHEAFVKRKYLKILERFAETEQTYLERSQAKVLSLEGPELKLEFPQFEITGIPDRIDENENGLFVMDYKTASQLPHGVEMIEAGYRLQLPFYAIAAQALFKKKVVGVQFIQLNKEASRGQGVFFSPYNGKHSGCFTNSRSKLNVLDQDIDSAWKKALENIVSVAEKYSQGFFEVKPQKETECRFCAFQDLCGKKRAGVS